VEDTGAHCLLLLNLNVCYRRHSYVDVVVHAAVW
jgi:hypothetical protein